MKYIDIHSHFNLDQFDADRDDAIKKMEEKGVATICVGTDKKSSLFAIELAEKYESIYACVGQHPTDTEEAFDGSEFATMAEHPKVVAIGECGFDYFRSKTAEQVETQKALFIEQIKIAEMCDKPLMIHARPQKNSMDAYEDALEALSSHPNVKANFHFFVGDINIAKRIVERGYTVSYDGPITFSNDYDEVIKFLPLENIMAETDAPFAAPAPYRGKRCEPWMVEEVVKRIAEIKGLDLEIVQKAMLYNTKRVFGIEA